MKQPARFYDEEMTVRALRWRRPRLVVALLVWSAAGVVFAALAVFFGSWAFGLAFGCMGWALGYLFRIVRINRRLEDLER